MRTSTGRQGRERRSRRRHLRPRRRMRHVVLAAVALALTALALSVVQGSSGGRMALGTVTPTSADEPSGTAADETGSPRTTEAATAGEEALAWPLAARWTHEWREGDVLLGRGVMQFWGASFDDYVTVALSIENAEGPANAAHVGYVYWYADHVATQGWLADASNALADLSIEDVNELLRDFPANAERFQSDPEHLADGASPIPNGLFNGRWTTAEGFAGVPEMAVEPVAAVPELRAAAQRLQARLDLPTQALVAASGGSGGSRSEPRAEIVFARTDRLPVPVYATYRFPGWSETLEVLHLRTGTTYDLRTSTAAAAEQTGRAAPADP